MKSQFVRPSVRLWYRLALKLLHGLLSNFSCCFPWAICPDVSIQDTVNTKVLKVILGSLFHAFFDFQQPLVSRKWLVLERNGAKFGPSGEYSVYTGYV